MKLNSQYYQFKLSNNDEIIAEVVSEPDDDDVNLVIRKAMMLVKVESQDGYRYYSFRPWMTYQTDKLYLQLLNITHIIGEAKPDKGLLEQYFKAVEAETSSSASEEDIDSLLEEIIKRATEEQAEENLRGDSDEPSNVIRFIDKKKLH